MHVTKTIYQIYQHHASYLDDEWDLLKNGQLEVDLGARDDM